MQNSFEDLVGFIEHTLVNFPSSKTGLVTIAILILYFLSKRFFILKLEKREVSKDQRVFLRKRLNRTLNFILILVLTLLLPLLVFPQGEPKKTMYSMLDHIIPALPEKKPRYLMGVGAPDNLVEGVARGIDLFDCALPSRVARTGAIFTWEKSFRSGSNRIS